MIGWDLFIKERVNYLSCIEGNGGLKDITLLHKMPRYLLIYYKISFVSWVWKFSRHIYTYLINSERHKLLIYSCLSIYLVFIYLYIIELLIYIYLSICIHVYYIYLSIISMYDIYLSIYCPRLIFNLLYYIYLSIYCYI